MPDLLDPLDTEVSLLAERDDITVEEAFLLRDKIDVAIRRAKEISDKLETFLLPWMIANNVQEFISGTMRHYVANKTKQTRVAELFEIFEAVLSACDGDI